MADKLDRIIGDYVNGRLDARIKSIESRYLYKQKVDNLGIRTAYSGGSEPESHVLNKEALENDEEYIKLKDLMYQFNLWYDSLIYNEKEIVRLKHFGYGGLTWYRVIMELENEGIEISEKKAKFIYYRFRKDIAPHIISFI
ncbi:RinA family protein [Lactococcus lactis]|uniref:RinA family protein n=1 Tax=Lactococcus lactis TaxID=1358 RepID=UPI00207904F0|nr:RinA family protein [Lactococcus lactis]USI47181.1 RinA family protein [Lactococcus lactis]